MRQEPSGDLAANRIVQAVIGIFELAFPGRVRGYYLRGMIRLAWLSRPRSTAVWGRLRG